MNPKQTYSGLVSRMFELENAFPVGDECRGDKSFRLTARRLCSYAVYGHSIKCKYQSENDFNPTIRDCLYEK